MDCYGHKGRKQTKETWECDAENKVDICTTAILDCSDGDDWGLELGGEMKFYHNGQAEGVGQGWDCRSAFVRCMWLDMVIRT